MTTETIQEMAAIQSGAIVSKNGSVTLFAMAQGESITSHTSECAALASLFKGTITFTVDREQKELQPMKEYPSSGEHTNALWAEKDSRMLLIQKEEN